MEAKNLSLLIIHNFADAIAMVYKKKTANIQNHIENIDYNPRFMILVVKS